MIYRYLLYLIVAALCGFFYGRWTGVESAKADQAVHAAKASEQARKVEASQAVAFNDADRELLDKWREQSDEKDRVIADLRAGTVRLRQRLAARVPDASTSAGQRDAGTATGLRPEDAEFLVRLAEDADRNTEQLAACQRILSIERK